MTKDFKPGAWFLPQPVMIIGTYDEDGTPNAMNAAWGGQWDYKEIMVRTRQLSTLTVAEISLLHLPPVILWYLQTMLALSVADNIMTNFRPPDGIHVRPRMSMLPYSIAFP